MQIDLRDLTADVCQAIHSQGARVQLAFHSQHDTAPNWERAVSLGVDFLESDRPEEVVAHLVSRQFPARKTRLTCHRGASRVCAGKLIGRVFQGRADGGRLRRVRRAPSRDGQYYLLHDGTLDRTTNGRGPIRETTNAVLAGLDAGSWLGRPFIGTRVPTLDQFLAALPPHMNLYFDAKDIRPEDLAAAIAKRGLSERTVVYQSAEFLTKLKQLDSRVKLMPPAKSIDDVTRLAGSLRPFAVDASWRALSADFVDKCHAAGIQVFSDAPFYVTTSGYTQAIAWGVDVIQTDFPLRYWRAVELSAATPGAKP